MTTKDFSKQIRDRIAKRCALPFQLPSSSIEDQINDAKIWFWDNHPEATQPGWATIPKDRFLTPEFLKTRKLVMPDCIQRIWDVREIKGNMGNLVGDFNPDKLLGAELALGGLDGDGLVFWTAHQSYYDLAKAFTIDTIAYDYSPWTHKLAILGRNPQRDVAIQAAVRIEEEALYEMPDFREWVLAKCKVELSSILGMFDYNLLGGIKINYSDIREEGTSKLEKLEEDIQAGDPPAWMLHYH